MYRQRYSYWSLSKLSLWLRKKAGLKNIKWGTLDDFDKQKIESSKQAPFTHWLTDTAFDKLQDIVYFPADVYFNFRTAKLWKFLRNLWLFRKALYNYVSWDYSGLLEFMETATKDMSRAHKNHGVAVKSEQTAKELKILSLLLKRIRKDEYYEDKQRYVEGDNKGKTWKMRVGRFENIPNTLPNTKAKGGRTIVEANKKNDLKLATKIIERKLFTFWD